MNTLQIEGMTTYSQSILKSYDEAYESNLLILMSPKIKYDLCYMQNRPKNYSTIFIEPFSLDGEGNDFNPKKCITTESNKSPFNHLENVNNANLSRNVMNHGNKSDIKNSVLLKFLY